eukprot:CAMPEP_0172476424 /NCGR_PEP_ID=MMETSP1065-20121228/70368_1 /TAXON_ID=265537 /ORGANISM="Amphiprora paludosa, Strain CCMP125" /LENGTH=113 /DNA_ID=CAMNT_0013234645 /DNA_START=37 /DNA_END=379 /DNA_ORIENTATION=-
MMVVANDDEKKKEVAADRKQHRNPPTHSFDWRRKANVSKIILIYPSDAFQSHLGIPLDNDNEDPDKGLGDSTVVGPLGGLGGRRGVVQGDSRNNLDGSWCASKLLACGDFDAG